MTSSRIACDQNRPPREPRRRLQTHAVPTTKLAVQVQISQQRTANIQEPFDSSEFPRPAWLPRSTRATTPSSSTPAAGVALPSPPEEPVVILHPYLPTEEAMNGTAPRQGRSRAKDRRATLPVPPGNDSHSWWIGWRGPARADTPHRGPCIRTAKRSGSGYGPLGVSEETSYESPWHLSSQAIVRLR